MPIPFAEAGGPVNVYLLEEADGGVAVFDTGLDTPEATAALDAGFRAAGKDPREVRRIVVSHGHVDHYGGAQRLVEGAGGAAPVFAHPDDTSKIWEKGPRWRDLLPHYATYFQKLGVPVEDMIAAGRDIGRGLKLARRVAEVRPIAEGDVVRTRHATFRVLHMPGHTPGLVCLWDEEHRLFLAADHLLEKVSPNPLIELGPDGEEDWNPLLAYLESVRRLRALDVGLLLPGHGPPFAHHRRVIDDLLQFYERRQAKIRGALAERPLTGFEVTRALFPWAGPEHLFLAVSEAMGNLEVLEARGQVARELGDGVYRFRLLQPGDPARPRPS